MPIPRVSVADALAWSSLFAVNTNAFPFASTVVATIEALASGSARAFTDMGSHIGFLIEFHQDFSVSSNPRLQKWPIQTDISGSGR
jgi:hypothetical protein